MSKFSKQQLMLLIVLVLIGGTIFLFLPDGKKNTEEATVFEFENVVYSSQTILGEGYQKFTHPTYYFSIEYPDTFITEAFQEVEGGETIVFQTPEEEKSGFQIFILPFGEDEVITRERILEDVPFVTIDEPQEVIIGDNIQALIFWSEDPSIGKTREVWFVHDGNLYEITTYAHLDSWLANILSSWKFERKDKK